MVIKYRFEPRQHSKIRKINFIAFDTETNSDSSFICGAYYGRITDARGQTIEISRYADTLEDFRAAYWEIDELAARKRKPFALIGYNTSYDLPYLGDVVDTSERVDTGARFISAKTVTGKMIFDILNHVTGRLVDWIDKLDMKNKYGICKRDGYLETDEGKKAQVMDDARATYYLSTWLQDKLNTEFKIPFKSTKFAAALEIFRRNYFHDRWIRHDSEQWKHDFERRGYYGGRVEVFRRGKYQVKSYDVNSMYVSIMRDMPVPNPSKTKYLKDSDEIINLIDQCKHLMVECRVRVPKMRVGLLPYRSVDKKLIFPYGEWSGVYHSLELAAAMQYGAEILNIKRALYYPETKIYFRDYARMTLQGRKTAKASGDSALEQLYKYFGNGLYGKFGQQNGGLSKYVKLEQFEGNIEGLTTIEDAHGEWWVVVPPEQQIDAEHSFPIVSATIGAYARVKILHALMANAEDVIYCDTDSIKLEGTPAGIEIGDNPGQWGYEYTQLQEFYAPKLYGDKRKGIPKSAVLINKDENTEIWEFERPVTFRESFRRNIAQNTWEKKVKILILEDNKREWLKDGTSYPLYVYEDDSDTISSELYKPPNFDALKIMTGSTINGSCW